MVRGSSWTERGGRRDPGGELSKCRSLPVSPCAGLIESVARHARAPRRRSPGDGSEAEDVRPEPEPGGGARERTGRGKGGVARPGPARLAPRLWRRLPPLSRARR